MAEEEGAAKKELAAQLANSRTHWVSTRLQHRTEQIKADKRKILRQCENLQISSLLQHAKGKIEELKKDLKRYPPPKKASGEADFAHDRFVALNVSKIINRHRHLVIKFLNDHAVGAMSSHKETKEY